MTTESLSRHPSEAGLFPVLSPQSLAAWREHATEIIAEDKMCLVEELQVRYPFYILLEGRVLATKILGAREIILARFGPLDFVGDLTLLAGAPSSASVRTQGRARLLRVENEVFRACVASGRQETFEVVSALALRSTEVGAAGRQQEKLAAIGRIAAGLAHELNNPASSIGRQAAILRAEILTNQGNILDALGLFTGQEQAVMVAATDPASIGSEPRTALALQDEMDRMEELLGTYGIERSPLMASTLGDAGWTEARLLAFKQLAGHDSAAALAWLGTTVLMLAAVSTIESGSRHISEIVSRMRHYSHLDQAATTDVDVRAELDITLAVLNARLGDIEVHRDYCSDIPLVTAHGTELNQVWTNLIENAIDAMPSGGRLDIKTECDEALLTVTIADTGAGIPPEIQGRIFDPFFTTKDVGEGFGLGLDYVYRTVVRRHGGAIDFQSEPGNTCFRVKLPRHLARVA